MPQHKQAKNKTIFLDHSHTGKLRPHHHTSFPGLLLVLIMAVIPLAVLTRNVSADQNYQTYAVVPGPVPSAPAAIIGPASGSTLTSLNPIRIYGTCQPSTLVQIFDNQIMTGATMCANGAFSLNAQLFIGANTLIAREYNANDYPGPDSSPINLKLVPPGFNLSSSTVLNPPNNPTSQFYLTSAVYYRGSEAGQNISWPIVIAGGQGPYAISVGWGDGKTDLISRSNEGQFKINHTYAHGKADGAAYRIIINATDGNGAKAYLQFVTIVSGNKVGLAANLTGGGNSSLPFIKLAWQLLGGIAIAVLAFWIGEKRELKLIKKPSKGIA